MKKITVNRIVQLIEEKKLVLFIGAGVSIAHPSNIVNFTELQNHTIKALNDELPSKLKKYYEKIYHEIENGDIHSGITEKILSITPEYIFKLCDESLLSNVESNRYFSLEPLSVFKNALPNNNHFTIANLLIRKFIPAVFTTNFDLLIENSANQLSKGTNRQIIKKWKSNQFAYVNESSATLYKLHGCISDLNSIVITLNDVGKRCVNRNIKSLQYFLENYYTLFLGYRGADLDIFSYLATSKCKGIIWNTRSKDNILEKIKKVIQLHNGSIIVDDLCNILEILNKNFLLHKYSVEKNSISNVKHNLDYFTFWSKRANIFSKILIMGDIWDYIGEWEIAIKFFKYGWWLSKKGKQKDMESIFIGRITGISYKNNNYKDVIDYCNMMIKIADEFPPALKLSQSITAMQFIGLVKAKFDQKKANQYFIQCLKYQEELEKIDIQTRYKKIDILINAGNNLFKGKLFDEAKEIYNEALSICDELGDVHGRARMLTNVGSIKVEQNKLDNGINLYKEAEYLFKETGDIYELADILLNISKAYFRKKNNKMAKKYARKAMVYHDILLANEQYNNAIEIIKKST